MLEKQIITVNFHLMIVDLAPLLLVFSKDQNNINFCF